MSEMYEMAGESANGDGLDDRKTDSIVTVDLSAGYELGDYGRVYFKVDNLLDEAKIVSRRPYGARPSKPRQFTLGYKYQF